MSELWRLDQSPGPRRLSLVERLLVLRHMPAFEGFVDRELEVFAANGTEKFFRAGEVLLAEGEPVESVYVVVEGRVELRSAGLLRRTAAPGLLLGTLDALSRSHGGVQAIAVHDTLALEVPADAVFDILEDSFTILSRLMRRIAIDLMAAVLRHRFDRQEPSAPPTAALPSTDHPLDLVERMIFVRHSTAFSMASMDAIAQLAKALEQVAFPKGATLWREGDAPEGMVLVCSGTVRANHSRGPHASRYRATGVVGGIDLLAGAPRWNTAVAEEPVVGLRVDRELLLDLLEEDFELATGFLGMMARMLLETLDEQERGRAEAR